MKRWHPQRDYSKQEQLLTKAAHAIEHDMDQRLLERTVELAQKSKGFDWKLPKPCA